MKVKTQTLNDQFQYTCRLCNHLNTVDSFAINQMIKGRMMIVNCNKHGCDEMSRLLFN